MSLINDRKILISVGNHRRSVNWQPQTLLLSELYEKMRIPARSPETMQEYLNLKKSEQDDLKDVGGYVAGGLVGTRRKAGAVAGRDVITLDLDNIPPSGTEDVLRRVEGLGCGYCVYSTRKHSPSAPRLRVLLPLDRTATADEYEPLARKMADTIRMELADPTTFDVCRLMYWPSTCVDSEYIFNYTDKPMLSVDGLLALYEDWRDVTAWPRHKAEVLTGTRGKVQIDPTTKDGVIGAFCRVYDVPRAIAELIPDTYAPVDTMPSRYTYANGSTTGGAVLYDGGKFLYSHHATDPCGGIEVNAFDLVRLHKFEGMDDEAKPQTPTHKLPSYAAMCDYAKALPEVHQLFVKEAGELVQLEFSDVAADTKQAEFLGDVAEVIAAALGMEVGVVFPAYDQAKEAAEYANDERYYKPFTTLAERNAAIVETMDVEFGHRQKPGRYVPQLGKQLKKAWVPGQYMLTISEKQLDSLTPAILENKLKQQLLKAFDGL